MDTSLKVVSVRAEARDVISIELMRPDAGELNPFEPGAHLEVLVPSDGQCLPVRRHYSLCNPSSDRHRYVVAVALHPESRGGSRGLHDFVHVGMTIDIQGPRNAFPLAKDASFYRFIAGGIGITPILSMIYWCEQAGKDWSLLYCARSRNRAAFYETLKSFGKKVRFHFDEEMEGRFPDLDHELASQTDNEHVYCCGPNPLMHAVKERCANRPQQQVHFEWFGSGETKKDSNKVSDEFEIVLTKSEKRFLVPADKSILDVLEENAISVPYACREGVCRSCETILCSGEADHRDYVLSEEEQKANHSILICVSRAKSDVLELDL